MKRLGISLVVVLAMGASLLLGAQSQAGEPTPTAAPATKVNFPIPGKPITIDEWLTSTGWDPARSGGDSGRRY